MTKRGDTRAGVIAKPLSPPLFGRGAQKMRRAADLFLCVLLCICLNGCWSQRELNQLAIVVGTGLDKGTQPDTVKLTAQVIKAAEMGMGSSRQGGKPEDKAYVNMSATEESVFSAVREITHMQNRRLYFAHSDVLIFGRELAEQDMAEGLDVFAREYETRLNIYIMIAKGSAAEVLKEDVDLEKAPALHISGMMDNQKANSETAIITLRDFLIAMLSGSTAPVAPMIGLYEEDGKKYAGLEGTGVFKQNKLVGELDRAQTRGLLWATNKVKGGATTVETPWGQVALETLRGSSSLKPVKTQRGEIGIELDVNMDGIIESNETAETMTKLKNVDMLKGEMEKRIRSDIESALAKARELSADVFGFGEAIRRDFPKEWEKMKEEWDTKFSETELTLKINVELRSSGGLKSPVVPGGAK